MATRTRSVTPEERKPLLERLGRWYGEQHFAVAFTNATSGDEAKRIRGSWNQTAPLADGPFAAGLIGNRGLTHNVAIVLRPSNLIVLECDSEEDLVRINELELPTTMTVQSSEAYKRHFYFRPPADLDQLPYVAFRFESGKLTADSGRYFLAPPSIHPTGAVYSFLPGLGPGETEIAQLPAGLYRQLAQQAREEDASQRDRIEVDPEARIQAGNRRDMLFRYACMLRRWGLSRAEISTATHAYNEARCDPPVERSFVEVQVEGAMRKRGNQELEHATENPLPDDEPEPAEELEPPPHSWTPIDLLTVAAAPPEPPTIGGLVYPGRRHLFSGEPESLKSWVALVLCLEQIREGQNVMYVDFEMGGRETLSRLRAMGATDDELRAYFIYIEPDESFQDPEVKRDTVTLIGDRKPSLIILDAFTGALQVHKLDPNKSIDVEAFYRGVVDPLRSHNAGVVVLDHLAKDPNTRGRFAIGSERKVGAAEVHLGFEVIVPFGRGRTGRAKITTHKDRPGFLPRPRAAELELVSSPTSGLVTWKIEPGEPPDKTKPFRPTALMEKISRYLELRLSPASRNDIESEVSGNNAAKRTALRILIEEGFAHVTDGPRNAHQITSNRVYREDDDFRENLPETTRLPFSSPSSPNLAPSSPKSAAEEARPTSSPPTLTGRTSGGVGELDSQPDLAHLGELDHEWGEAVEDAAPSPDDDIPF